MVQTNALRQVAMKSERGGHWNHIHGRRNREKYVVQNTYEVISYHPNMLEGGETGLRQ